MVQVPYSPVPDVTPQVNPTGPVRIDTPLAAFGGAVAQATSHLGEVESHVGDELFARANALQELNQQADAATANSDYVNKLGQLHADYTTKLGKDAIDGYQPFVTAVNQARMEYRASLGSPIAQRAYDQESRTMMSRAIWSGSSHLAQQNKSYLNANADATMASADNYSTNAPNDDAAFKATLDAKRKGIDQQADLNGWSDETKQMKLNQELSKSWSSRLTTMARANPQRANQLLQQATKDGEISSQDSARLQNIIDTQNRTVGSRIEGNKILAGQGFGTGKVSWDVAAQAIAGNEGAAYETQHPDAPNGGHALGHYGIMNYNLAPWLKEAGMAPMSESEFLHDHAAQDQLFHFKWDQYQEKYGSAAEAARHWFGTSPKGDGHWTPDEYVTHFNAGLARRASGTELEGVARSRAKEVAPDDPLFSDTLWQHVETEHYRMEREQKEDEFNHKNTVIGALKDIPADGKLVGSLQELFDKGPDVQQAYEAMNPSDQAKVRDAITANVKRGGYQINDTNQAEFWRLQGIANDPHRTPDDTDEFLRIASDPGNKMPMEFQQRLTAMGQKMLKLASADPQIPRALGILQKNMGQQLIDAGIDKKNDPDTYNQFIGQLTEELKAFQQDAKKAPLDEDIIQIGGRLLKDTTTPGWLWGVNHTPFFKQEIPEAIKQQVIDKVRARGGGTPSDDYLQRVYVAMQYQDLYGRKPKTKVGAQ